MAGIAGIYGEADSSLLSQMLSKMVHRGPESQKTYLDSHVCIGQNNMKSPKWEYPFCDGGKTTLIMDGMVFMDGKGQIGPEVITDLYGKYGLGILGNLKGYFSLALLKGNSLLLARDPLGIKPLYYGKKNRVLYFASEMKSLIGIVDNIVEFIPGTMFHTQTGFHKFYSYKSSAEKERDELLVKSRIREVLMEAVRMYCDLSTGAFLSGGIDSSIIAALASQFLDLHTFCVGLEGSEDLESARIVAKHIGSRHHEKVICKDEIFEILPKVIYHLESFDVMLVRGAVAHFLASELASKYVDSSLCGEGGDELFAGYEYLDKYRGKKLQSELEKITFNSYNTGLQRVDRMPMAHSIEGKMPFLYNDFVKLSLGISTRLKRGGKKEEKWILRKAFEDMLPEKIVWRKKRKFAEGAGNAIIVKAFAEKNISDDEFREEAELHKNANIRTKEELYYFRIFENLFGVEPVRIVGRTEKIER